MPKLLCRSTLIALICASIAAAPAGALDFEGVVDSHDKTIIKQQTQRIEFDKATQLFLCFRKSTTRPNELSTVPVLVDRNGKEVSALQAHYIEGVLRPVDNTPPGQTPLKSSLAPASLRKISKDGLFGISDIAGNIIVPPIFDKIHAFWDRVLVLDMFNKQTGENDLYCFDTVARKLSEHCVTSFNAPNFAEGLCAVHITERSQLDNHVDNWFQYFNANMDLAFPTKFSSASQFLHGLAVIKDYPNGQLFYYIDKTGKRVSPGFSRANTFIGDCAIASSAENPDKYGLIDKKFEFVTAPEKCKLEYVSNNRIVKQESTDGFKVLAGDGKFLSSLPKDTKKVRHDDSGMIVCELTSEGTPIEQMHQIVCDANGKVLFKATGYVSGPFSANLALLIANDKPGIRKDGVVDMKGQFVIPPEHSYFEIVDNERIIKKAQQ